MPKGFLDRGLIPIELVRDLDGCMGYCIGENIEVNGERIYAGNIVNRTDMAKTSPEIPIQINRRPGNGRYLSMVEATAKLKDVPAGMNAILYSRQDGNKKEIPAVYARLETITVSDTRRLAQ